MVEAVTLSFEHKKEIREVLTDACVDCPGPNYIVQGECPGYPGLTVDSFLLRIFHRVETLMCDADILPAGLAENSFAIVQASNFSVRQLVASHNS